MKFKLISTISVICLILFCAIISSANETNLDNIPLPYFPNISATFPNTLESVPVQHDFIIQNKGVMPFKIRKVKADWGCTTVSFPKQIPAGGQGTISIKIDTNNAGGKIITKKTKVYIVNDPKVYELKVTGKLKNL